VPSQTRDFLRGSVISDTHFPHARIRTPRYDGAAVVAAADVSGSRARFRLLLHCCFLPPPASSDLGEHEDAE
jgi:hypothetical protein